MHNITRVMPILGLLQSEGLTATFSENAPATKPLPLTIDLAEDIACLERKREAMQGKLGRVLGQLESFGVVNGVRFLNEIFAHVADGKITDVADNVYVASSTKMSGFVLRIGQDVLDEAHKASGLIASNQYAP